MAATVGRTPDDALVNRFIGSLSIAGQSNAQPPAQSPGQPVEDLAAQDVADQDLGEGDDLHNLSKLIGGASALLGIGLLVFLVIRGKKSRPS